MVGRREGDRCSPWGWRDTRMCVRVGCARCGELQNLMGGPLTPNPHSERSEAEPEQREQADRGMGAVVGGHTLKDPCAPFYRDSQVCSGIGKPLSSPQAPQNPPNPNPGPKPGVCQQPVLPRASSSPGPWGHIPAAGQGRLWLGHSDPHRFPTEPTPLLCPTSSARAGNRFP